MGEREFGETKVWRAFSLLKSNIADSVNRKAKRISEKEQRFGKGGFAGRTNLRNKELGTKGI